eukprot:TRINITY_DN7284_c0_g1_i3.p1 TRINITY_DN7284_c0_g1~~TRINITY_DN7284_c0_g1_i3.p1  ORF type:complete len:162 (-),score=23.68 TRINITY_DN7284_c0_g1_i3:155-640(-)
MCIRDRSTWEYFTESKIAGIPMSPLSEEEKIFGVPISVLPVSSFGSRSLSDFGLSNDRSQFFRADTADLRSQFDQIPVSVIQIHPKNSNLLPPKVKITKHQDGNSDEQRQQQSSLNQINSSQFTKESFIKNDAAQNNFIYSPFAQPGFTNLQNISSNMAQN